MSTDKTLADVQPGGRVRLGDQAERARFEGWAGKFWSLEKGWWVGQMRYHSDYAQRTWEAWQAALSAQASPAVQGDALALADQLRAIAEGEHSTSQNAVGDTGYLPADVIDTLNRAATALAARQPVGQEPAYNAAGLSLTACQLHEALLMAGDPELDVPFEDRGLVRIFWTEAGHSGPGLYCECVDAEEEGCILLDGTAPAIQQPAQAVDLGRFRKLASWVVNCAGHGINDSQRRMGEELLALIDSQAVCK